jgi:hypothetical protein
MSLFSVTLCSSLNLQTLQFFLISYITLDPVFIFSSICISIMTLMEQRNLNLLLRFHFHFARFPFISLIPFWPLFSFTVISFAYKCQNFPFGRDIRVSGINVNNTSKTYQPTPPKMLNEKRVFVCCVSTASIFRAIKSRVRILVRRSRRNIQISSAKSTEPLVK